jgi:predicted pyridoxine 5'-phosphate oxidase superfamily flavin-nucleotide-binding protein
MSRNFTNFAFTDSVKAAQSKYGSRASYARMETAGDRFSLTTRESEFLTNRDSFYLATVGENGWPYVQFRGGPRGFVRVLDERTIGFADFRGNRQYISLGNLTDNAKAALISVDYPRRERLKIWATAKIVDSQDDPELADRLAVDTYDAVVERSILLTVEAFDWNCPQHIPPKYTSEEIALETTRMNPDVVGPCGPNSGDND